MMIGLQCCIPSQACGVNEITITYMKFATTRHSLEFAVGWGLQSDRGRCWQADDLVVASCRAATPSA